MMPGPKGALGRGSPALAAGLAIVGVLALASVFAPRSLVAAARAADPPLAAVESTVTTAVPLPLRMADTHGCEQLLIATGPRLGSTTGTLRVFDLVDGAWVETLTVAARFGRRGLIDGTKRRAGSLTTPTGIWAMPDFIFGTHREPPAGTKMKYRLMTRNTWWSSKRGRTYNTWVRARRWKGEHIGVYRTAYEYAVSMGYNARPNPSVCGRGSGIFLHVHGKGLTAGCVSISRANMIRVCRLLDPAKRPHFAVGTLTPGTRTSIRAY